MIVINKERLRTLQAPIWSGMCAINLIASKMRSRKNSTTCKKKYIPAVIDNIPRAGLLEVAKINEANMLGITVIARIV